MPHGLPLDKNRDGLRYIFLWLATGWKGRWPSIYFPTACYWRKGEMVFHIFSYGLLLEERRDGLPYTFLWLATGGKGRWPSIYFPMACYWRKGEMAFRALGSWSLNICKGVKEAAALVAPPCSQPYYLVASPASFPYIACTRALHDAAPFFPHIPPAVYCTASFSTCLWDCTAPSPTCCVLHCYMSHLLHTATI